MARCRGCGCSTFRTTRTCPRPRSKTSTSTRRSMSTCLSRKAGAGPALRLRVWPMSGVCAWKLHAGEGRDETEVGSPLRVSLRVSLLLPLSPPFPPSISLFPPALISCLSLIHI
eukprot:2667381-Rhodomonas_salina.2